MLDLVLLDHMREGPRGSSWTPNGLRQSGQYPIRRRSTACKWRRTIASVHFTLLWGEKRSSHSEERVSRRAKRGVVMKTAPCAPLEVIEADLAFQFLIVPLNAPPELCQPN